MEVRTPEAAIRCADIVEVATLERAGGEVALDEFGGVEVAEGEDAALLRIGFEGGTALQPYLRQLAARKAHRPEPAIAERGTGKIGTRKIGTQKIGIGKIGSGKIGTRKIGTRKIGTQKIGTGKIGSGKIGTGKIGTEKIGTQKIGIGKIGTGKIGAVFARIMSGFGCRLLAYDPVRNPECEALGVRYAELAEVFAQSEIISLHCPLTDKTRGLIGAAQLARMKPDALLVNTARGPVIDEAALVRALQEGRLGGAGLDTFAVEPPDPANPLFALPNVIVTPHIAAATTGAMVRMGTIAANNIISWLRGEVHDPRNFLNPQITARGR